jgi:hypothetical protein
MNLHSTGFQAAYRLHRIAQSLHDALRRTWSALLAHVPKRKSDTTSTDLWTAPGSKPPTTTSTDLWKFFEEKGAQQKESMFKLVTWIVGFAAVILGFAVKEGFEKGLGKVAHPFMVLVLGGAGFLVIVSTIFIIYDHGRHINRTFARADAARNGESAPWRIWQAGKKVEGERLPPVCRQLLWVIALFGVAFAICIGAGLFGLVGWWLPSPSIRCE